MGVLEDENRRVAFMKVLVLVLLCAQNSVYALLRRYSQGVLKERATPSSILLVGEIIKLIYSWCMIIYYPRSTSAPAGSNYAQAFSYVTSTAKPMIVPAVVYLIMNLLSYVALQRIDAGLFTVFAQGKLLTTGVFSVWLLGKRLHARKWRALILTVLGTILISNQTKPVGAHFGDAIMSEFLVGVGAVSSEVLLSGFISVYFEKVLKAKVANQVQPTVWDRNFQLASLSAIIYFPIAVRDSQGDGILAGWSMVTLTVSVLGAAGGILVALCVKYTDSIIKGMATSGAIISTTFFGYLLLDAPFDLPIVIGAACVILAIYGYNDEGDVDRPVISSAISSPLGMIKASSMHNLQTINENQHGLSPGAVRPRSSLGQDERVHFVVDMGGKDARHQS